MAMKIKRYGWVHDLPDQRDHLYAAPLEILRALPEQVDLRGQCPSVYDQGDLGSCTANAIAAAVEFERNRQGLRDFMPSRLFIYYNERALEGTVDSDSGAQIRDGIKTVASFGDCPEEEWPYDVSKFADKPTNACYLDAAKVKAVLYSSLVQNLNQMKGCLASGFPFVFGFTVYESFESSEVASTGVAQMPGSGEQVIGGHAVVAVGYDDSEQRFIVRNSWNTNWGMRGYFTMPYAYLTDPKLSSDFWTIRLITA
ncbi:C1 family peptidase [Geomesophilobacter sediminis]|uniref:C1 family peptidase n=1 Tax=Geomesophilobacter sediminis TaxID=2798584 RepID=A0A8J7M419_9BACT|nr:C1 family peptidase [Geomesophilobacter sediminis]MBJ6727698.1 C1 family peptidase [Geomesophilobacter sediminis]